MIGGLRPHASLKPNEKGPLAEIPDHWDVRRAKYVLREVDARSTTGDEELLSVSQYAGVKRRGLIAGSEEPDTRAASLVGYKKASTGDLVVNIMLAWNGSLGVAPTDGIVSPAYCVYRFRPGYDAWYYHYLLRSAPYRDHIKVESRGIVPSRLRLYTDRLGGIPVPAPPVSEQRTIVSFLHYADRRIAQFIANKQQLRRLLLEQKQTLIYRAVTGGGAADGSTQFTDLNWRGIVPGHWKILPVKRVLAKLIDCEHKTAPPVDGSEFRVVRTTAIRDGQLQLDGTYCTDESSYQAWTRRGVPEAGDVMFTREAPAGEACVVPPDMRLCLGQRTVLMKVDPRRYDPRFLVHMIYSGPAREQIQIQTQGSTVGHFNMDDIAAMPVLAPPLEEQRNIVRRIDDETGTLNATLDRTHEEMALIREYRERLIVDVVTGKLDARTETESLSGLENEASADGVVGLSTEMTPEAAALDADVEGAVV